MGTLGDDTHESHESHRPVSGQASARGSRQGSGERVPASVRRIVLLVLAVLFLAVGLHQAARDAPTVDEGVDLSSGVIAVTQHDLRMVPEHPPLAKVPAALGALLGRPVIPITDAYRQGDWFDYSDDFISANEAAGRLRPTLFWARSVVLLQVLGCAALLYLLTRRWFGADGALLVAVAWLTTPYVVGLGHFAMIDLPFTLAVLGLSLTLTWWRDAPSTKRAVVLGAVLGASLATRHTALVLVALAVVLVAVTLRDRPRQALQRVAVVGLVAVAGLWAVYRGLDPSGASGVVAARFEGIIATSASGSLVSRVVTALPLPLEWRAGFAYLDLTSTARPSSLLGQSWDGGRWWYFPVSAAVKLPLTLTVAVVAGWVAAIRRAGTGRSGRGALAATVAAPALVLWLLLVAQPLNLGLRLAMPIVALALVGLGALASVRPPEPARSARSAGARVGLALLAVVLGVQLVASAVAVPHSLAWTPPPFTPAYQWVSDANLDAGQALYEVRAWSRRHDHPWVALDSTRGLDVGGGSRLLRDVDPAIVRGWVAVGVTPLMQTRRDDLAWLRAYCPVGTLGGGSVLVYRFASAPSTEAGPERPVSPCFGAARSQRRG